VARGLVVFDLDGTLVDSADDLADAVNATLGRIAPGAPPLPTDQIRGFVGQGARSLVERALRAASLPRPADDVLPVFMEIYGQHLLDKTRLYPGVAEALETLEGYTLAVLTNKPGGMSRAILEGLGVARRFARICGPDDLPAKKPDPAGLRQLMSEAGAPPAATAMVGDSAIDVLTGRAAGVATVGVSYGLDAAGLRAEPPDVVLDDLRQLAGWLRRPRPRASVLP